MGASGVTKYRTLRDDRMGYLRTLQLVCIVEARATFDKPGACARLLVAVIVPGSVDTTDKYDDQLGADDGPY